MIVLTAVDLSLFPVGAPLLLFALFALAEIANRRGLIVEVEYAKRWRTKHCPICGTIVCWLPEAEDEPETCGDNACHAIYDAQKAMVRDEMA